jgi:hypothetical protein
MDLDADADGLMLGETVGSFEGESDADGDALMLGETVGSFEGESDADGDALMLGETVGSFEGESDADGDGLMLGETVGSFEGERDALRLALEEGVWVILAVIEGDCDGEDERVDDAVAVGVEVSERVELGVIDRDELRDGVGVAVIAPFRNVYT